MCPTSYSNPFSQGWDPSMSQGHPSIFGALPCPGPNVYSSPDGVHSLVFSPFNPTILNCIVRLGPEAFFFICTDEKLPGYTVWKDASSEVFALLEWADEPLVEIRGLLSKRPVTSWLCRHRDELGYFNTMKVRGVHYVWRPNGTVVCLYHNETPSETLATIIKSHTVLTLQLTEEAMELGLLEACVIATTILQSGRSFGQSPTRS